MPLAALTVVCFVGAELGQLLVEPTAPASFPAFWPPAGVLVAALITSEWRRWGVFVLAACGSTLLSLVMHDRAILPSLGISSLFGLDACVAAWLVRRFIRDAFALDRLPHAAALVFGAMLAPLIGGRLAADFVLEPAYASVSSPWLAWWLAEVIGILVTAPLVVAAISEGAVVFKGIRALKALEVALVFSVGIVLAQGIFGGTLNPLVQVPAYILPFLLWPAFRFGPWGASSAAFVVSFIALGHASRGEGPFAPLFPSATDLVLRSQSGVAIAAVSLLLLASIVAERKRVAQERVVLLNELQQAFAEIKTLRGLIPICAWCHKVRDDAGFWHQLERYLDARTDATFSHSICPSCTELEREEIASHAVSEERVS